MPIVPKKAADSPPTNVRSIRSGGHAGGRKSSQSYDPATGSSFDPSKGSAAEYDLFAGDRSHEYSEDRFYTRSVDKDGHGQKLNLRVPQGIDSQMHAMVQEVPEYKTLHDLIRDAVMHRLEYLQKRYSTSPKAQMMLVRERAKADRYERTQDSDEQAAMVEELETTLATFFQRKDWMMMREELEKSSDLAEFQMRGEFRKSAQQIIKRWTETSLADIRKAEKDAEAEHE